MDGVVPYGRGRPNLYRLESDLLLSVLARHSDTRALRAGTYYMRPTPEKSSIITKNASAHSITCKKTRYSTYHNTTINWGLNRRRVQHRGDHFTLCSINTTSACLGTTHHHQHSKRPVPSTGQQHHQAFCPLRENISYNRYMLLSNASSAPSLFPRDDLKRSVNNALVQQSSKLSVYCFYDVAKNHARRYVRTHFLRIRTSSVLK